MKAVLLLLIILSTVPCLSSEEVPNFQEAGLERLTDTLGITEGTSHLPGVRLAEGISQMTGVAISPLLGVSGIGAWNYFRTDAAYRDELPWVCHPACWGIGMGLLLLCFFKDSLGAVLPSVFKKPLDLLELFENKCSALVASAAFLPFLVQQYTQSSAPIPVTSAGVLADPGTASITLAFIDVGWIVTPLALIGFFVVWLVSHTINVLIVMSPFGLLDAILKAARFALLSLIGVLYLISPVLAAILSVMIIALCAYLAPRAFRIMVFGAVISWDWFRGIFWRPKPDPEKLRCFLARPSGRSLRARTQGRVGLVEDGRVCFRSRRLFVGPWRTLALPDRAELVLVNGVLFPVIQLIDVESGRSTTLVHLLPRYRHCTEEIAEWLGLEVQDCPVTRGVRAAVGWLREVLRSGREKLIDVTSTPEQRIE